LLSQHYQPALKQNGIACQLLDADGSAAVGKGVRLATMHRMKGLEFPTVIIAGINADTLPLKLPYSFPDQASKEDFELGERCLLYVAATRARDELAATGWGRRSPLCSRGQI
jgi:superfamily I DNA/RNA helicase